MFIRFFGFFTSWADVIYVGPRELSRVKGVIEHPISLRFEEVAIVGRAT